MSFSKMLSDRFRCPTCNAKGWVLYDKKSGKVATVQPSGVSPELEDWWRYCPTCSGACTFTLNDIARKLDENPATMERLTDLQVRSRVATCTRILDKLLGMMREV